MLIADGSIENAESARKIIASSDPESLQDHRANL
jgi:hypothetical protein